MVLHSPRVPGHFLQKQGEGLETWRRAHFNAGTDRFIVVVAEEGLCRVRGTRDERGGGRGVREVKGEEVRG